MCCFFAKRTQGRLVDQVGDEVGVEMLTHGRS
jgi:hypothetical protein